MKVGSLPMRALTSETSFSEARQERFELSQIGLRLAEHNRQRWEVRPATTRSTAITVAYSGAASCTSPATSHAHGLTVSSDVFGSGTYNGGSCLEQWEFNL
jgi:hypothetical protein